MEVAPSGITADRNISQLIIQWDDGHLSTYSFSLLRHGCPCAECRGGHENMSQEPDQDIFYLPEKDSPSTRLRNLEAVGTYAISIEWEDGHDYGIYNWHYLRALCPCEVCRTDIDD